MNIPLSVPRALLFSVLTHAVQTALKTLVVEYNYCIPLVASLSLNVNIPGLAFCLCLFRKEFRFERANYLPRYTRALRNGRGLKWP